MSMTKLLGPALPAILPLFLLATASTAQDRLILGSISTVSSFTLEGGATSTPTRRVDFRFEYTGLPQPPNCSLFNQPSPPCPKYRIKVGTIYVTGSGGTWLDVTSYPVNGEFYIPGDEGTKTVQLEIRKDTSSTPIVRSASIELRFPRRDYTINGSATYPSDLDGFFSRARDQGYGFSYSKTSSTGRACAGGRSLWMEAHGDIALVLNQATTCEFRFMTGKQLQPGWTLKSVAVQVYNGLPTSSCQVVNTTWNTSSPTFTVRLTHPGSINPLDRKYTTCYVQRVVLNGPDDPDQPGNELYSSIEP